MSADTEPPRRLARRALLLGSAAAAASAALTACSDGSAKDSSSTGFGKRPVIAAGTVLTPTSAVPVGGGVILDDTKTVVTQPEVGTFRAFSAVCTHAGCLVTSIENGQIVCPCHTSHFSITDGSVISGPAPSPLPATPVKRQGTTVVAT